jgi:hypothetical protein
MKRNHTGYARYSQGNKLPNSKPYIAPQHTIYLENLPPNECTRLYSTPYESFRVHSYSKIPLSSRQPPLNKTLIPPNPPNLPILILPYRHWPQTSRLGKHAQIRAFGIARWRRSRRCFGVPCRHQYLWQNDVFVGDGWRIWSGHGFLDCVEGFLDDVGFGGEGGVG